MRPHSYALAVLALAGSSLARPDGVGGHHHHAEHGVSAPGPSAPQSGYAEPQASYGVPDSGYGAPDTGYGAPNSGYGAPPDYGDYGVPSGPADTAVQGGESAMSMIIIPILIAAALFLLFPSVTTVPVQTAGKRKRDVSSEESPAENMISRVQDMYMAILESEECFERIACEIGGLVEDAGYSKQMTKSMELFAPKKYAKMVKSFNHGKDCKKNNKCGYF